MKKITTLIVFIGFNCLIHAQECATPTPTAYSVSSGISGKSSVSSSYCLNLYFHIVRRTNGTGGVNPTVIDDILNVMNSAFLPHEISIQSVGNDYIDSDALFDIGTDNEANQLFGTNNQANAINVYLVNSGQTSSGIVYAGLAQDIPSRNMIIDNDFVLTSTAPHELGHCLNLLHTHETYYGVENINGSNCSTAGDKICDTPADPQLSSFNVDVTCNYTGGNGYSPLTDNIMSYSRSACRDLFTDGQVAVMKNAIPQYSILSDAVATNCQITKLIGDDCTCSNINTVITLQYPPSTTVNWTTSTNMTIVSSTNSSVTVKGVSGTRSQGQVTASFNGIQLTKDVWVGEPSAPSSLSGPSSVLTGAFVNYNSSVASGASSYEWRLPYPFDVVTSWNYNGQRWQMRTTTDRYLTAYTGMGQISGLVQVMGKNKCGVGGAKTKSVSHSSSGGGGIPLKTQFDGIGVSITENQIYPNPANERINILLKNRADLTFVNVTLSSMDGKVLFKSQNKNLSVVPTEHLTNGVYILNIITDQEIVQKSIIISH